mgnify:CR=1 FL=1
MITIEKSRLYLYDNKYKKAIKELDALIKKYPVDADLYVLRGDIKKQIKQTLIRRLITYLCLSLSLKRRRI